jgi:hypothetical protein
LSYQMSTTSDMSRPLNTDDNSELERYLLGLLPADATERLDEESIADDEFAVRLRTVETDLIDSYVRGQLAGATLARFESYYLSSPRRREAVRVAANFVRAVDRSSTPAEDVTSSGRIARPTRLQWIAAAAALVTVVGGSLLFQAARPRRELTIATSATGATERPTREAAPPVASDRADRIPAPPQAIAAMVLLPPTRAVTPVPTLAMPPAVDRVSFELRLEVNDFPRYRVELNDPVTSRVLWRSDWMSSKSSADQISVSVIVPANLLKSQRYSLDLTGQDSAGREDVIGSYPVRIVQR